MTSSQVCTNCRKKKPGRYTRIKGSSGRGSDKGMTIPTWQCWSCLPAGQGAGETDETTAPIKPGAAAVVASPAILKAKDEGASLIGPLQTEAQSLVVDDAESYLAADQILGRIQTARKTWAARMERIIRPIRQGLDEIYGLNRDVDKPLEAIEKAVKNQMTVYKLEEQRQLRELEQARIEEVNRLQRQINEQAEKETAARTAQMRQKLAAARQQAEDRLERVQTEETTAPIMGVSSSTRSVKKWRVTDFGAMVKALAFQTADPALATEMLMVNTMGINKVFKESPDKVAAIPGLEVYDDVQIVGR